MIIKPSQKQIIGAKKVIDDVKEEIDLVQKNYDNDKVDINPAKGEVEINYNPKSELAKVIDGGAYKEKIYGAKISHDAETGELKDARVTTSKQLREWHEENSYIDGIFYSIGGGDRYEVGASDMPYTLKETKYEEVTEKSLPGKEKKKEVYTQFEDGKGGNERFTRIEVDKKTGQILDVDTSKGSSALKEARKEFSQLDDKRLLINSKDPDFKVGKFTNKELKIAGAVMARVKDDMELAKKYDNVRQYDVVRWVDGEDKDTRPGEIDLPETRLVGENDPLGRLGPFMKRLVDKVKMSFDPATGDVKSAEISTYTRVPGSANDIGFSRYEEKTGINGKTVSVYFHKVSSSVITVEADKNTGEILNVKHFDSRDAKKGLEEITNKATIGAVAAGGLGTAAAIIAGGGGSFGSIVGGLIVGTLAGCATGLGVGLFMEEKGEELIIEHKSNQAYPKEYLNKLKTEEKEAKEAGKKAEKKAKEAKKKAEKKYEISQRSERGNYLKSRVDNVKKSLAEYDNEKADLNPEKGKVLIDESYSSACVNPSDDKYSDRSREIARHGKLSADPETGEIKKAEVLTNGNTLCDNGGSIYKYEEAGTFLGLGKKKEVHTYYNRNYDGEYYSKATIDKESGEVRDFKEWHAGKVFDEGTYFQGDNFLKQFVKPLEAMKMKHQLKKRAL